LSFAAGDVRARLTLHPKFHLEVANDPKIAIRRIPFVFAQEERQNRQTAKSWNIQDQERRAGSRESSAVL
jgi:hypothetical protein